jgi:transposase
VDHLSTCGAALRSQYRNELQDVLLIIGTPERFARGKQIGIYVGMIPTEDSSAGKQRLGHISKQGNSLLRYLLVEAAQSASRFNAHWRRRYMRLAMRRHRSIAKVAMGRRMAIRLYWMWRNVAIIRLR